MFNKNLEAVKAKNPELAKKLEAISLEEAKTKIEVYQAESKDIILSYEGLALDDIYDPIRVSKTNWNMNVTTELKKFDIVLVYGLGLGYLFKRAYVSCVSRILLYEPKIDILRYVLEYVDFSNEFADARVYISSDKADAMKFLTEKYLSGDNLVFLYPKAYSQLLTKDMADFTNSVLNVCDMKKMDVNTVSMLTKHWGNHSIKNIFYMNKTLPFSWLKNKFSNKTFLITAAGPSLGDNFDLIKANRDKFVLISVNRAASYLAEKDIIPDFVVVSDIFGVKRSLAGYEEKLANSYFIVDSRANSFVSVNFNNILTYFSKNDLISQNLQKVSSYSFELMETAGTAAAQAYSCAKLLGANEIIFAGLDLAFKQTQIYANGEEIVRDDDCIVINKDSNITKKLMKVKNINGEDILTRDDYALFIRQFEEIFSKNSNIKLYNISDFGAYICGMEYKKLEEILQNHVSVGINIKEEIDSFREEYKNKWLSIHEQILKSIEVSKDEWSKILSKTTILLDKELALQKEIASNNISEAIQDESLRLAKEFSEFLPELSDEPYLAQYFQSEFLNFLKLCDATRANNETITKIKEAEIQLLEEIKNVSNRWINFVNRYLK